MSGSERFLEVRGSAHARALQQAQHFGPGVLKEAREALTGLAIIPPRLPQKRLIIDAVVRSIGALHLRRHRKTLQSYEGGKFWQGLQGLSQGFGASISHLYGFGAFEIEASRFGFTFGCTSLAVSAEASPTGRALLAYNHDFPPQLAQFPFVRRNLPDEGFASLSVSYPMVLGTLCGMNSAGLALTVNHAWVRKLSNGPALLISYLAQDALDRCASVEEAVKLMQSVRVPNGSMVSLVDASGDRAVVELTPQGGFVRRTRGPVLHTFNNYQTVQARQLEVPVGATGTGPIAGMDIHGPNLWRQHRYDDLGTATQSRFAPGDIDAVLADHAGGTASPDTICRHNDPYAATLFTARLDPLSRRFALSFGTSCQAKLEEYQVPESSRAAA